MTKWTHALIQLPRFSERPSGLFVPVTTSRPVVSPSGSRMGDGMPIPRSALFIMANPPSAFDQMRMVLDESSLDQRVSTPDQLKAMTSHLAFENGMLAISRLASHVWHLRGNPKAQIGLADYVFGEPYSSLRLSVSPLQSQSWRSSPSSTRPFSSDYLSSTDETPSSVKQRKANKRSSIGPG